MGIGKFTKSLGFKNVRQVLAKAGNTLKGAGNTPIGKAIGRKIVGKINSYKKGGHVHKTGLAFLHKGEYVVPAHRGKKRGRGRG